MTPTALLLTALAATSASPAAEPAATRKPNILIIVGDDMGYADVGFHGCKEIPTPHLDALAKGGVRFTSGYVSGPYCSPTRAGLLTGRYQQRFGHEFNSGGPGGGLPVTETTIADRFKAAGYKTGLVGKWHLGSKPEFHPQKRGFDEFYGFLGGMHTYFAARDKAKSILRGNETVAEEAYLTDAFSREAVAFIDRHKAEPWLLYLAFNAVHTPMHADDSRLARFAGIADKKRQTYAAMMVAMDDAVGAVMRKLAEAGIVEDTLVVFFSDNGGPTMVGTTTNASINAPLRGSKRQTLEGGVRVPFVMHWKGKLPAGTVYDKPVIQLDVQPTALAAAGIEAKDAKFDGVNLLPYLTGTAEGAPHDTLYWRFGRQIAIRRGEWKLVRWGPTEKLEAGQTWPKLYNLAADIGEAKDLSAENPDKVKELDEAWSRWNAELPKPAGASGSQPVGKKGKKPADE
jgi:arylsulfatase A-like enzyme